jgi:hypothetical protein
MLRKFVVPNFLAALSAVNEAGLAIVAQMCQYSIGAHNLVALFAYNNP